MRWMVLIGLAFIMCVPAVGQMPSIVDYEVGSELIVDGMERAEDYLSKAEYAVQDTRFTAAQLFLKDAELELALALEFGLPTDHMAAKFIRDGIAKCHKDIEDWGGDESEQQLAETWWARIFTHHTMEMATPVRTWVEDAGGWLNAEETYWMPAYFTRIIEPDVAEFKEKYPDKAGFVALIEDAGLTAGNGNPRCPTDERDEPRFEWMFMAIEDAAKGVLELETRSVDRLVDQAKKDLLGEDGGGYPTYGMRALDGARVLLTRHPDNEMAEKIRVKAEEYVDKYREENAFHVEDMRMPADENPGDAALHAQMKAAYEKEAQKRAWNEQVLRVVVTSNWSEGAEAWWVENEIHAGYFKRIHGAVAVKKETGCRVMLCLFRQQLVDGNWGDMYLGKVTTSYGILEENINE